MDTLCDVDNPVIARQDGGHFEEDFFQTNVSLPEIHTDLFVNFDTLLILSNNKVRVF